MCYTVAMMNETNITNEFKIYRYGKIDRSYEAQKFAKTALRFAGRILATTGMFAINAVDELVTEFEKL